ncbi:MAG TPA: hypothetical protein VJ950_06090 [Acidimicrobiia bacterium]|nr:hypothetical protein [Acidimicrobiia bacterium]
MAKVKLLLFLIFLAGCAGATADPIDPGDSGDYSVTIDPADFVPAIDNDRLPFRPGSKWVYESIGGEEVERIEVVVTEEQRTVMGVSTTVVRDTVTVDGELVEDTYDWYAQDQEGNVWYFGEETAEYEDGEIVSRAGAWEAGVDGAMPGIVMGMAPTVGDSYRQEYYPGEAEDMAEVVKAGVSEEVVFGAFDDLIVIEEWTPLEPDVVEEKYYASGVGVVLETTVEGGSGRIELISFTPGS